MHVRNTLVAVVEDDPSMRHAIERLLRVSGMACIGYESAESFLAEQREASPDFAVIDVNLDGADGLQLQARLKAAAPELPVIVITGPCVTRRWRRVAWPTWSSPSRAPS